MRSRLAAIFLTLPRTSHAYPFYILATVISSQGFFRALSKILAIGFLLWGALYFSSFFLTTSLIAFLLSFFLQVPFFLFLLGVSPHPKFSGIKSIRTLNTLVFLTSLFDLLLVGFPLKLPYVHYLPDVYSATFGMGGAKIVTVIGFFGLAIEIFRNPKDRNKWAIFTSFLNFLVPNYLLGILSGISALSGMAALRRKRLIFLLFLMVPLVAPYALNRYQDLNTGVKDSTGVNPKVYAYLVLPELWTSYPHTFFLGTGQGQFSSIGALWTSEYMQLINTHGVPTFLEGERSDYHRIFLGPVLGLAATSPWVLSSSANKPYTTFSTLLSEYGLPISILILTLTFRRFKKMGLQKKSNLSLFFFCIALWSVDIWHDNPWFGFFLFVSSSATKDAN